MIPHMDNKDRDKILKGLQQDMHMSTNNNLGKHTKTDIEGLKKLKAQQSKGI